LSGVVFDTSVYIAALRHGRRDVLDWRRYDEGPLYLSAVAVHELYMGSATLAARREVDRLWRGFEQVGRLFVPTAADWRQAGLVLSQVGQQFGYGRIARGRLTNDALLAMSALSLGLTVVTLNARDFSLVAQYRSFKFRVVDPNKLRI
jgi:predicted nucleic acid-binding protein